MLHHSTPGVVNTDLMVLGDIEYGDLIWFRISAMGTVYRLSVRTEQGGVEPPREFLSWIARLDPAPAIIPGEPLDMALIYDAEFDALIIELGIRVAFVTSFGFVQMPAF